MSFSMSFFRKKSERNSNRPSKPVFHSSTPVNTQPVHTNGNIIADKAESVRISKNMPQSRSSNPTTPVIFIKSLDTETDEMTAESSEKKGLIATSQLSKTLEQVLRDKDALPQFIQFMTSLDATDLVQFWLDADTFRTTSLLRINSESTPHHCETLQEESTAEGRELSKTFQDVAIPTASGEMSTLESTNLCRLSSVTAHGHGQFPQNSVSGSPTSVPKLACESASLAVAREQETAKCQSDIPSASMQSVSGSCTERREPDPSVLPSGIVVQPHCPPNVISDGDSKGDGVLKTNFEKPSSSNNSDPASTLQSGDSCEDEQHHQKNLQKSIEHDAIVIFSKYLSPDCSQPISISDELRTQTIGRICHEDGTVDPCCFDDCQKYVFNLMETQYYSEFLQSVYYIKHQIDILSQLELVDILYNDTALSYFTEFMEEASARSLLQCFLDLDNFKHHLLSQGDDYDRSEAQNDAMIIYDKYISMQATQPVRFDDKVRLQVEANICQETGPLPGCFEMPCLMVLKHMEQEHFQRFLKSEMYTKYVTDLLNTSHLMQDSIGCRRKRAGSDASSEISAGSQSIGNESVSSKNTYLARDTSGQHFAKALNKFGDNMRIDSSLFNPDSLWHRPKAGCMKFGKVTELGQFVSDFDPDPDHAKKKLAPFFTAAKRREKEKSEEDMAWQAAQKIINDVMSETSLE